MEGTSEALAARMTGPVMVPGDAGYDAEVTPATTSGVWRTARLAAATSAS